MTKKEHKIGKNIKKHREKLSFKRYQLSKLAGMAFRTFNDIEIGVTPNPRISTVKKIAEALSVPINDLLSPHKRIDPQPSGKREGKLGKNIRKSRLKLGINRYKLSKLTGLAYSTLTKIESGAIPDPRIGTLKQIADALDLRVDDLLPE